MVVSIFFPSFPVMSSGFITEGEAAEIRKKRQEEWEKVRKASDPLERPEEPYDSRSLYERLQEQKQKKDLEYEEAHKLKNMIKGLDDDEIEFLDLVDRTKLAADRKITIEEEQELNDYRNRVASLQEKSLEQKLHADTNMRKPKTPINRSSQVKLLKGVVVKNENRKRKRSDDDQVKSDDTNESSHKEDKKLNGDVVNVEAATDVAKNNVSDQAESKAVYGNAGLTCIGILPGLGCYNDDSSSDASSDSDREDVSEKVQTDMLGRKILKKEKES